MAYLFCILWGRKKTAIFVLKNYSYYTTVFSVTSKKALFLYNSKEARVLIMFWRCQENGNLCTDDDGVIYVGVIPFLLDDMVAEVIR